MTAAAHARRGVWGRLVSRDRRHVPADRITMRTRDFGDGPKIIGPASAPDPYDYNPRGQRPPWETAPQPAYQTACWTPLPAGPSSLPAFSGPHPVYGHDGPGLAVPEGLVRPYSPEPEPCPEPVPYPPLPPLKADYQELPIFQAVTRGACRVGLRGLGIRSCPPLPDFGLARHDDLAGAA